jgi:two-component system, OmpR family, sensor histidine kinase SenX3
VTDQGPGIAPEDQSRVFSRFFRADSVRQRADAPGLGLGLYLVREVVRRHGGDVELVSSPGKGSEFTIRIFFPAVDRIATLHSVDDHSG